MLYTYLFALYPTKKQKILLAKHFGAIRFLYNHFLQERKTIYQESGQSLNYYDQAKHLTALKQKLTWLKEVNSQSQQFALKSLDSGFNRFFKKLGNFPKFHSKNYKQSFRVPQFVVVENNLVKFPKFKEGIRFNQHRRIEGKIQFATVSKDTTGKYFVAITVEKEILPLPKTNKMIGIDLGVKDLIITSEGEKIKNPKNTKKYSRQFKILQQYLCRKIKGSQRRERCKKKIAKLHKKIRNSRIDTIHKATIKLVKENDLIVMEDLNAKGMVKNRRLAKSISDCAFGEIKRQLEYKCKWYQKKLVQIGRWYPSSKTCHQCGYINQNLTLSNREWECPQCATKLDRDINASQNILSEGLRNILQSLGTSDYTDGAKIRPEEILAQAMKSEAPVAC